MTDVLTRKQRSYNMSMIRCNNTHPERILRTKLFNAGYRGFKSKYKLLGKPDFVFPKDKIALFVDGCFWHKCPKCFKKPRTNTRFWELKINGNVKRDKKINCVLKKQGWKVVRIWEHDINKKKNLKNIFTKIEHEKN